jgi:hypothetical protein
MKTSTKTGWLNSYASGTSYVMPSLYTNVSESTNVIKPKINTSIPIVPIKKIIPNSRVVAQNQYIQANNNPEQTYAIVDKKADSIYYYNNAGNLIDAEPVITGASNNERDYSLSMKEWMKKTGNTNHDDYFKWVFRLMIKHHVAVL